MPRQADPLLTDIADYVIDTRIDSDEAYRTAIREGAPKEFYDFTPMPAIGSLDEQQIADVIAYVRSVQDERGFND